MITAPRTAAKYAEIFAEDDHEALEKMKAFAEQLEKELDDAKERIKRMEEIGGKILEATVDLGFLEFTKYSKAWREAKEAI